MKYNKKNKNLKINKKKSNCHLKKKIRQKQGIKII